MKPSGLHGFHILKAKLKAKHPMTKEELKTAAVKKSSIWSRLWVPDFR